MNPVNYERETIKAFLKDIALLIKIGKQLRKQEQNQRLGKFAVADIERAKNCGDSLWYLRYQARHFHVAYCELRGRTRSQIEANPETKLSETFLKQIKDAMIRDNAKVIETNEPVLYVVVRKDLAKSSQAVQAGHALAQFLIEQKTDWKNGTLVYLSAPNEAELIRIKSSIGDKPSAEFKEPDLDNQLTAVAVLGSKTSGFVDLPLL